MLDVTTEDHLIDAIAEWGSRFAFAGSSSAWHGHHPGRPLKTPSAARKRMGFANTLYEAGTAEEVFLAGMLKAIGRCLIVDPPRTGLIRYVGDTVLCAPENGLFTCSLMFNSGSRLSLCRVACDVHSQDPVG